ncbi:MAG TPA: hypothetical protein VGV87_20735 [Blastocatellia bacterium]|jgi:hypothetical protein|nr:hypothetical protein [Blastocatellia bacterium]
MKRFLAFGSAATILFVASIALAQSSPSVVGSWDLVTKTPSGDRPALVVIKQEGGKLSAVAKSPQGERPYESMSLTGNDIKFVMTIQFQGADMVLTYTGKVDKDGMKGEVDFGGLAQGEWSAVPHKEMAAGSGSGAGTGTGAGTGSGSASTNVSGVWNATVETPQGTGNPVFTFKQEGEKITGNYKGTFGEAPLTGTLKGGEISFSFKVNMQGQNLDLTYTGKVDGNNMKGKAKLGELGEADWTAKKQ